MVFAKGGLVGRGMAAVDENVRLPRPPPAPRKGSPMTCELAAGLEMDTVDNCWRSGAVGDLDRDSRTLKRLSSSACSLFFMSMLSRIYSTSTSRTALRKAFQSACPVPTFSLKMVGRSFLTCLSWFVVFSHLGL